jgi:hypothetical protein
MRFQVGRFTCELSRDHTGRVQTTWFRRADPPKYLSKAEREQYQTGRAAFLDQLPKTGETGNRAATMKRHTAAFLAIAIAALVAGCARGGGIGLEAMVADNLCEQRGFHLGTPEYANCRNEIAYQRGLVNAQMQMYYQRQYERTMEEMNRSQTCVYNGSTIGGVTGGTMTCR